MQAATPDSHRAVDRHPYLEHWSSGPALMTAWLAGWMAVFFVAFGRL